MSLRTHLSLWLGLFPGPLHPTGTPLFSVIAAGVRGTGRGLAPLGSRVCPRRHSSPPPLLSVESHAGHNGRPFYERCVGERIVTPRPHSALLSPVVLAVWQCPPAQVHPPGSTSTASQLAPLAATRMALPNRPNKTVCCCTCSVGVSCLCASELLELLP